MKRVRVITDVEAECKSALWGKGIVPGAIKDVISEDDTDLSITVADDNGIGIGLFPGDFEWVEEEGADGNQDV